MEEVQQEEINNNIGEDACNKVKEVHFNQVVQDQRK